MAINQSQRWRNENTLILAASGGGKSQMLNQLPDIPYRGARVILWDPDRDHRAHHYSSRGAFVRALKQAVKWANGKPESRGYRVAYTIADDLPESAWYAEFEWFCDVVWRVLDGNHRTHIIVEEMADPCRGPGAPGPYHGRLMRRCRKYGGQFIGVSQRSQEIPKNCFSQCDIKYIGKHNEGSQAEAVAKACSIRVDLVPVNDLHFVRLEAGKPPEPLVIQYKAIR